jgi:hypothetical protein
MLIEKSQKISNKFNCEKCNYTTSKQSDYTKHLNTRKHIKLINVNNELIVKSQLFNCPLCKKEYKSNVGLWKHKKTCNNNNVNNITNISNNKEEKIDLLINEHIDFKNILIELVKSNTELQKQMLEVCKNNNTTINSHNKTFNMQVFLNEKCKDAMNIMEFVDSMNLQLSDLEELGELGYVEGISRQMIRKLSELDVYKRPIHCSDLKRETIYIRDNGVWEKENITYDKLRKAIKYVTAKNGYLLEPWRDAHPQCMNTQHPLNDVYVQIMSQAMGGRGEFADSENKIIKKVSKVITIDKNDY